MSLLDKLVYKQDGEFIRSAIADLDNSEAKEAIQKLKKVYIGMFAVQFSDSDKLRFSTISGIEDQLRDFSGPVGLLYYFTFVDGKLDMNKQAVALTKARFEEVHAYKNLKPEDLRVQPIDDESTLRIEV